MRSDCGVTIGVKFCCCCCCRVSCFHRSAVNCPEWLKVISQLCAAAVQEADVDEGEEVEKGDEEGEEEEEIVRKWEEEK